MKWTWLRTDAILGALVIVGIVHYFMIFFEVPTPDAWALGAVIDAALVSVLFSNWPLIDKVGVYCMFFVVTLVGALTVCPCTAAHFILAPPAGLAVLGLFHLANLRRARASNAESPGP